MDWYRRTRDDRTKMAQGQGIMPPPPMLPAAPQPPAPDFRKRVEESLGILLKEAVAWDVVVEDYDIDSGSRGSFYEEGYDAFIESLDATVRPMDPKSMHIVGSDEAAWLGVPEDQAIAMWRQSLPMKVPIKVEVEVGGEDWDMKSVEETTVMVTGIGNRQPDGTYPLAYTVAPISY